MPSKDNVYSEDMYIWSCTKGLRCYFTFIILVTSGY